MTIDVTVVGTTPYISTSHTQYCGSPVTLTANVGDALVVDDCDFSWAPTDYLNVSDSISTTIDGLENTTVFTVSVIYETNGLSCPSEASIEIETCEITIPNVFTPNNDGGGFNNTWKVDGLEGFDDVHCYIYNRWGLMVFESIDFGNDPWTGENEFTNTRVPEGVYYYVFNIPCNEGDQIVTEQGEVITNIDCDGNVPFKGTIHLFR